MATTNFTTSLKLALPTTGDLTGTWGQTVNDSITTLLDTAVAGNITKDMAALGTDWTLTSNNGATDEARYAILIPYGTTGATRSIFAPKVSKSYIVVNKTNASVIIRGGPTSPTTGVTVATGATVVVAWDSNLATPDFVAITPASISGVVPVANGGTGLTAVGTTGNVLTSNGTAWVSSPPSTTVTTATNLAGGSAGTIPYQSASGTTAMLAAGTATYVLTANGAAAPTWQPPTSVSGYLPLTGGTMTGALELATGTAIASASTVNLNAATGNRVHITGTTAITAVTLTRGPRTVIFDGVLTLTHNSTTNNLPGAANITTAAGDRAIYESDGTTVYCISYTKASGAAVVGGATSVVRSARTANTILGVLDNSTLIDITSGTFTQTFTAAATLGSGWFCYLRNSGTGDITLDPNASELIDGLTSYVMYSGETRLVQCDGTAFTSVVLSPFYRAFTSSGTFTKAPGYRYFGGLAWGGGASGKKSNNITLASAGGGGGGCINFQIPSSVFGATETATIGAGGAANVAASAANSNPGGTTTLGALFSVFGGSDGNGGSVIEDVRNTNAQTGVGYEGAAEGGTSVKNLSSVFGGAAARGNCAGDSGNSIYGGAAGGGLDAAATLRANGTSKFGGNGSAASSVGVASSGVQPGGGGGATQIGSSGAGGAGEIRIWGIA